MIKQSILALAAVSAGTAAYAAEAAKSSDVAFTLDVTYVSDYVFRGIKVADSALQPSLEATYADFYAGAWHSNEISDHTRGGVQDETDLYVGFKPKIDDTFSADIGVTRYLYNGGSHLDTSEVYVGITANVALTPSLYAYYDFDQEIATYIASIGYSLPLEAIKSSLDFSVSGGFVDVNGGQEYLYGVAGVAIPYKLSDTSTLTVGVDYIANDDDKIGATALLGGGHDTLVGKVGLTVTF
ncbi:MAG: hypothetical protein RIQ79_1493 [Verrucomicrobiota bacterium]|jgi:uncharacterized protein (TIGR02001 family)